MKSLALIIAAVLLAGCGTTKLTESKPKFPGPYLDPETKQMPKCPDLKQIPNGINSMSEVFKIVVENYTLYYHCSNTVDGWAEWYTRMKKEYDKEK